VEADCQRPDGGLATPVHLLALGSFLYILTGIVAQPRNEPVSNYRQEIPHGKSSCSEDHPATRRWHRSANRQDVSRRQPLSATGYGTRPVYGIAGARRAAGGESAPGSQRKCAAKSGKPWSDEEDHALAAAFDAGKKIPELATSHQRSRFAIEARLGKLGKIEPPANLRGNKAASDTAAYSTQH